jgi:hypothetical protein
VYEAIMEMEKNKAYREYQSSYFRAGTKIGNLPQINNKENINN